MYELAGVISTLSIIPAFLLAVLRFGRNKDYRPFYLLILFSAAIDLGNYALNIRHINNLWLINVFILLQYYLIIGQLHQWLFFKPASYTSRLSLLFITVLWLIESYYNSFNQAINNYTLIFSSFLLVIFVTVHINRLIFEKIYSLASDARFVISVAFLFYFTSSLLIFIFDNPHSHISDNLFLKIWTIHNIINTFTNVIFALGLLCIPKK